MLGYGSADIAQPDASEFEVLSGVDRLDESYLDEGYLDGNPLSSVSYPMYGNAQNMALSFGGGHENGKWCFLSHLHESRSFNTR